MGRRGERTMWRTSRQLWPLILIAACHQATPVKTADPPVETPVDPGPGPCTTPACTPPPPVEPYTGDHLLDAAVHETLARAGVAFRPEGTAGLCRRLMADLLGRYPS